MKPIILDSGPLIALFDGSDTYHHQAVVFLQNNPGPYFTTLAVITEVNYVLDFSPQAQWDFLDWISRGAVEITPLGRENMERIRDLMKQYQNLPMDFTDGTLIVLAEKLGTPYVATVDKDFHIYRWNHRKIFKNPFFDKTKTRSLN